jgi:purine-binding chemotaxis protein CheW
VSETADTGASSSWDELARQAAHESQADPGSGALRQLLAFTVAESAYAVSVESVREIVRMRPITPIPRVSADVRGVISLRGEVIQVIDMRRRLGFPVAEIPKASRIIVVQQEEGSAAGILVDSVREVLRVDETAMLQSPGGDAGSVESLCVRGDEFISMINLGRVLNVDAEH